MYHGVTMVSGFWQRLLARMRHIPILGLFFEPNFIHYAWIGGFISVLNVFLLWLFIDVLNIATVVASIIVIGGTFLLRYIFLRIFNV